MTPEYGRAPVGERLADTAPRNRGVVTTIIGGMSLEGLTATMTIEGGTTGEVFRTYVNQVLVPELHSGEIGRAHV